MWIKWTAALTWARGLDLGLVLLCVRVKEVGGRVLPALDLTLEGVQTLDVLLLERAGGTARRAHIQAGGQLPPLLILVDLATGDGRVRLTDGTEMVTLNQEVLC